MGTTGATLHCRVQSLAEAQQFAESLRSEFSRIEPGSGWFRGQVEGPVAGGRNTLEFPAKGRFDEGLWQFADGPLPESASARRIEGEWDVSLRDPAMEVRFRSTADGEAADARWRANATEGEGHAERLVRLWDATAAKR